MRRKAQSNAKPKLWSLCIRSRGSVRQWNMCNWLDTSCQRIRRSINDDISGKYRQKNAMRTFTELQVRMYISTRQINTIHVALFNPLQCKGNYIATSHNTNLIHWPLMGGPLHLVQRWGDWAGPQARSPPRPLFAVPNVTTHAPINGQCTNHRIAV